MQLTLRKLAPVLAVAMLALAGCQTAPTASDKQGSATPAPSTPSTPSASAPRTASPVEFYIAYSQPGPNRTAVSMPDGTLYLQQQPVLTREYLTEAAAVVDRQGQHFVGLRFNEAGTRILSDVSSQNLGNMLALVVNRELVAAPSIAEPLNRGALAFGVPTAQAAIELAAQIRGDNAAAGGAAPASRTVSPRPGAAPAPAATPAPAR
ncbi:SecDF P1 head subdomain-containing protein [Bordetella genomosp. 13]|uniref:Preprotein translocase subunit SecD n=1 Tax=Bordetella genomosp. 13 TaxID=463040 RepID=A0A1W6ZHN5_9BORD|nr:preprotein translocase subunit SecD [Bordetella genomosp. 13]ARP96856.1 preprotein translocase subunit SecD [Bordetella genomosp. 13]